MTTSFANRLAAGGVWALKFAQRMVEVSEAMRERGFGPIPFGDGSSKYVLNYSGRDAFNWICQGYLPAGHHAHVDMELTNTKYVARNGSQISEELWLQHLKDEEYRRVAYSCNPVRKVEVITIWTGLCINDNPNVYRTLIFKPCENCEKIHPSGIAFADSDERAKQVHQHVVNMIHVGKL